MKRNSRLAFASRDEVHAFQSAALRVQLRHLAMHSPFYQRVFREAGVDPHAIHSIDQLPLLPTTSKRDLQLHSEDFLCVPRGAVRDWVQTSGTLGEPVFFALTEHDLQRLAYNERSSFELAGLTPQDTVQLMTTVDRGFMAGLAYLLGVRDLGGSIIRAGGGMPEFQWRNILRLRPTACIVVPSFILRLVDFARAHGIDPRASSLRRALCVGEALYRADGSPTTIATRIAASWPELELFSTYASTEMQTAITDCPHHHGAHIPPELIIAEVLGPDDRPLPPGEVGELAITSIGIEGMPLLRFKTGDICFRMEGTCPCGRSHDRLSAILGRTKQAIKLKGTIFYPPALFDILDAIPEVQAYIVEVCTNSIGTDEVQIRLAVANPGAETERRVKNAFRAGIRVAPTIIFEPLASIEAQQQRGSARKLTKFLDFREGHKLEN